MTHSDDNWQYRILRTGPDSYAVHKFFYDDKGIAVAFDSIPLLENTSREFLAVDVNYIQRAFTLPVLEFEGRAPVEVADGTA